MVFVKSPKSADMTARETPPSWLAGLLAERRPLVMGILNVTPDSFSDGGQFLDPDTAIAHARQMMSEGADSIDIGAESTRPYGGAVRVTAEDELRRGRPRRCPILPPRTA